MASGAKSSKMKDKNTSVKVTSNPRLEQTRDQIGSNLSSARDNDQEPELLDVSEDEPSDDGINNVYAYPTVAPLSLDVESEQAACLLPYLYLGWGPLWTSELRPSIDEDEARDNIPQQDQGLCGIHAFVRSYNNVRQLNSPAQINDPIAFEEIAKLQKSTRMRQKMDEDLKNMEDLGAKEQAAEVAIEYRQPNYFNRSNMRFWLELLNDDKGTNYVLGIVSGVLSSDNKITRYNAAIEGDVNGRGVVWVVNNGLPGDLAHWEGFGPEPNPHEGQSSLDREMLNNWDVAAQVNEMFAKHDVLRVTKAHYNQRSANAVQPGHFVRCAKSDMGFSGVLKSNGKLIHLPQETHLPLKEHFKDVGLDQQSESVAVTSPSADLEGDPAAVIPSVVNVDEEETTETEGSDHEPESSPSPVAPIASKALLNQARIKPEQFIIYRGVAPTTRSGSGHVHADEMFMGMYPEIDWPWRGEFVKDMLERRPDRSAALTVALLDPHDEIETPFRACQKLEAPWGLPGTLLTEPHSSYYLPLANVQPMVASNARLLMEDKQIEYQEATNELTALEVDMIKLAKVVKIKEEHEERKKNLWAIEPEYGVSTFKLENRKKAVEIAAMKQYKDPEDQRHLEQARANLSNATQARDKAREALEEARIAFTNASTEWDMDEDRAAQRLADNGIEGIEHKKGRRTKTIPFEDGEIVLVLPRAHYNRKKQYLERGWCHVRDYEGRHGYIRAGRLQPIHTAWKYPLHQLSTEHFMCMDAFQGPLPEEQAAMVKETIARYIEPLPGAETSPGKNKRASEKEAPGAPPAKKLDVRDVGTQGGPRPGTPTVRDIGTEMTPRPRGRSKRISQEPQGGSEPKIPRTGDGSPRESGLMMLSAVVDKANFTKKVHYRGRFTHPNGKGSSEEKWLSVKDANLTTQLGKQLVKAWNQSHKSKTKLRDLDENEFNALNTSERNQANNNDINQPQSGNGDGPQNGNQKSGAPKREASQRANRGAKRVGR